MTCDDILWYLMCHLTKCKLDTVTSLKCWENDGKRNMHIKAVHYRTLSYNVVQSSSENCNPQQHILIEVVEQQWTTTPQHHTTSFNLRHNCSETDATTFTRFIEFPAWCDQCCDILYGLSNGVPTRPDLKLWCLIIAWIVHEISWNVRSLVIFWYMLYT